MKKVTTKKQIQESNIALIESNDYYGFGEGNEFKYVLSVIKKGYVFKKEKTITFPTKTIKECIDLFNEGFIKY